MRNHLLLFFLFLVGQVFIASAQRPSGEAANIDPLYLIDLPTAGILPTRSGGADVLLYPEGGVLLSLWYSPIPRTMVGISMGGTRVLGAGGITWNKMPGLSFRYRIFDENEKYPGLVFGFESQGKDGWLPNERKYVVKSPGFFFSVSKNYRFLGYVSFHGALNYTLERGDGDGSPNMLIGVEKTVGSRLSVFLEYNFLFDNDANKKGFWNGMLNTGLRVSTEIGLTIDLYFKNLLTNPVHYTKVMREIRVQYVRYL